MDAQQVIDALPDGVVLAGPDGTVSLVSSVAARMLGVDAATAVGRPLEDVVALQDNEGRTWAQCHAPYAGLRTRTGVPEQSWLTPDGTEVLVAARIHRPALDQPVEQVALVVARRGFVPLQKRVLLKLGFAIFGKLDVGRLQQLDRLLQLRRHHQGLALPDFESLPQSHDPRL